MCDISLSLYMYIYIYVYIPRSVLLVPDGPWQLLFVGSMLEAHVLSNSEGSFLRGPTEGDWTGWLA